MMLMELQTDKMSTSGGNTGNQYWVFEAN